MDIFKAEKSWKYAEISGSNLFRLPNQCLGDLLQPSRLQTGKKRKISRKSKTPGTLIYNVPGSRSGGIIALRLPATSIGATAHRADRLFRLRNPPTRFPPPEVVGGFPHGLTGRVSGSLPSINKNPDNPRGVSGFLCRSGGIRTRGLLVPNQTRYQTALHLDIWSR